MEGLQADLAHHRGVETGDHVPEVVGLAEPQLPIDHVVEVLRHQGIGRRLEQGEGKALPLEPCIARIVELTDRFFREHPGDSAIFMDVQATTADLIAIEEEADAWLIAESPPGRAA